MELDSHPSARFQDTADFIKAARFPVAMINILTPAPGTALFERLEREGRILHKDWWKYNGESICFRPKMDPKALEQGRNQILQEIYSYKVLYQRLREVLAYGGALSHSPSKRRMFLPMLIALLSKDIYRTWFVLKSLWKGRGASLGPLVIGIYLHEYAPSGRILRLIRLGINNLAGVPSVVFGLFGLAFFVTWLKFGVSIIAGALTLGAMSLPVIIGASEEALRAVPQTYREASLALGATKWQTIYRVVLPAALPGMLTGAILGLSRTAGETAPIMFTAAVFFTPSLPNSIFDKVMALPYHIYVLATAGTEIEQTRHLQYGTALVLIILVLGLNLCAILYRSRLRRRLHR